MPVPPTLIDPARNAATSAERGTWALGEVTRTSSSIHPATKREALWPLGSARRKGRASREAVLAALLRRERRGPTYIGGGIAMPHGRNDESLLPAAAVLRLRQPVHYATADGDMADILVAVPWPKGVSSGYVPTLARPFVGQRTRHARNAADFTSPPPKSERATSEKGNYIGERIM
ncbi:PTS sugar transporter subunit IIA [Mesorhizobium sp. M7A.F.Ca.US.001.04.1.1]|nr:PTS sugar transporter subunit IIA [Mesorhizobium sp. M7A.F.Ca.US.001.04.1.1]